MKTCVIGAEGFLGKAFYNHYKKTDPKAIGTSHRSSVNFSFLDLVHPKIESLKLLENGYSHALIVAAIPNIRRCELEKEATYCCNVEGTLSLARQLVAIGIQPILFSTDYVFDGKRGGYTERDALNPLNEYGRQKAFLEQVIPDLTKGNFLMIRLGKVFTLGKQDNTLVDEMMQKLRSKELIRAATDQIFSPVLLEEVIRGVSILQGAGAKGLYNLCGAECLSRFDLAKMVAKKIGLSDNLIQPIALCDLQEPFSRPCRTDLDCTKIKREFDCSLLGVTDCLDRLIKEKQ